MSNQHRRALLILVTCTAIVPVATAQDPVHQVSGLVSAVGGGGGCTDTDQILNVPAPSAVTSAGCVAPNGGSASGQTRADLATGSVGLEVAADSIASEDSQAAAQSTFLEQIVFSVPGGPVLGQDLLVDVTFTLDGVIPPGTLWVFPLGRYLDYNFAFTDIGSFADDHEFLVGGMLVAPFIGPQTFSKTVKVNSLLTAQISMNLFAPGISEGSIDFLNSATIAIDVPPGVTFVSDSGVFLSAPEPTGFALGVASLLALAGLGHRTRASRRRSTLP